MLLPKWNLARNNTSQSHHFPQLDESAAAAVPFQPESDEDTSPCPECFWESCYPKIRKTNKDK